MQVFLFGDSITYGNYDYSGGGWADRLKRDAYQFNMTAPSSEHLFVFNLGICGEATDTAVRRFRGETQVRIENIGGDKTLFVFAFGANDAAYHTDKKAQRIPIDDFRKNISTLIAGAKEFGGAVVVLNIPPVVEEVTGIPNYLNKVRLNKYVLEYNSSLAEICRDVRVDYVDVYAGYMERGHVALFAVDGLHPNDDGHILIHNLVLSHLQSRGILVQQLGRS